MSLWPHQIRGVEETLAAIARGERRICLTSPTGGGKTRIACELIYNWLDQGHKVALYTNRRLLSEQLSRVLTEHGIEHGMRAAGWQEEREKQVQICMLQTEGARARKAEKLKGTWQLHNADRVIVDEAHLHAGPTAQKILATHYKGGAAYVGLTATPIGLADLYDCLLVAGTVSELRQCGALVPCLHYGPDEPDLRVLKNYRLGEELTENQQRKVMMTPTIWGRVLKCFKELNPDCRPTILFAPGVRESIYFAEQFTKAGIPAAHIDGQEIWVNGSLERTSQEARAQILQASKAGDIRVLCNRFVLREGIDAPWLEHGILATVFGSLQSLLQAGGRLLRVYPGVTQVTLQDHGGNWHRHGSLNADREWRLEYTASMISGLREDRLRKKQEREPVRCPKCSLILATIRCACGYEVQPAKKSRPVVQLDGTLKEMHGDIYRPRRISRRTDGPSEWERMYWRSRTPKGERTFRQAAALFAQEYKWGWPNPSWPLMPKHEEDWFRLVKDVPFDRLIPKEQLNGQPGLRSGFADGPDCGG